MKRILGVAVLAASVLTLAACGSDDTSADDTTAETASTGAGGDFCDLVQSFYDTSTTLDAAFSSGDPAQVEAALAELKPILEGLRDGAPADLKDAAAAQTGGILELITIFEQYEYDVDTASTSPEFTDLNARMTTDEMATAQEQLNAYDAEVCGIDNGVES